MAERKIECNVLKVFDEKVGPRGITRIQIVSWNRYSPVLEKRDFWQSDDGEKTGKAKGLNHEDFQVIMENAKEIQNLLEEKED